ncbi:hypothetical protein BDZ97DRAFT_1678437 [Flammula alnicola]|nr:hypothetical protein BDZ97DRAFT_1678437 [Flammula alnicola]
MSTSATETDSVQLFFLHAGNVLREGRFILQSLPNAEDGSVERMVRQLQAIHSILEQLDDPWTTQEEIARLISLVLERLWRDVRRDTLEVFRTLFMYLEEIGLLDMESAIHRVCLFLTFHQRIQNSLDETVASWNLHKVRTAGNKTPLALYQISREQAINQGYWTGDPGDPLEEINAEYGVDGEESFPPADELEHDPTQPNYEEFPSRNAERDAGIFLNDDEEIDAARAALEGMNFEFDDGNFGIDVYCEAITRLTAISMAADSDSNVDK